MLKNNSKAPQALRPNPRVLYIQNHLQDFKFSGVSLKEGVSSKEVDGDVPARRYVVFEITKGKLTFNVGQKKLVTCKHHVTAFVDYDDSRAVTSAYHYTAICKNGEEVRVYVDKNFYLLDVAVKHKDIFISFSEGKVQGEKEAIYYDCYKYVENIFKHIHSIPDKARAYIDAKMNVLHEASYSLNENPEHYRKALNTFLNELEKEKEGLPAWYYQFHLKTKQGLLLYVTKMIDSSKRTVFSSAIHVENKKILESSTEASAKNSVTSTPVVSLQDEQREQLKKLQIDFESLEDLLNTSPALRKIQLSCQQWHNISQQIGYQLDINLSAVSDSLQKRQAIELALVQLFMQHFNELEENALAEVSEDMQSIMPMSQLVFSLIKEAIFERKTGVVSKLVRLGWIQKDTLDLHAFDDARLAFACNALRVALEKDALNVFQELLEIGVNPDSMTLQGSTYYRCIEVACAQGKIEFLELLLRHGSGDGAILPGLVGQFPMLTDPNFDNKEHAARLPMMIAAKHHQMSCLRRLAAHNHRLWFAVGCAFRLHDDALLHELTQTTENGVRNLGDFSQQMLLANQLNEVVEDWNVDIKNINFLSLASVELIKWGLSGRDIVGAHYSWCALFLLAHPALSNINILQYLSNMAKTQLRELSGQKTDDAYFTNQETDLMAVPLIGHFVSRLLKLKMVSEEDEDRIVLGEMKRAEYAAFDRDCFLQQVNQYYQGGKISDVAFVFKHFIKELASPRTNIRDLALCMYSIIFYNQQITFGGNDPKKDSPLHLAKVGYLLSALIQMKLVSLLALGRSAVLQGSEAALPNENQLMKMQKDLVSQGSLNYLSVLDEVIASADSQDLKVGVLQLKLCMLTLYCLDFYKNTAHLKVLINEIEKVEKDPTLTTACDVGRKNEKGYWWWESLQMQIWHRDCMKLQPPKTVATSSSMYQPQREKRRDTEKNDIKLDSP